MVITMPDSVRIAKLLQTRAIGTKIVCLGSVGSTNEYLKLHAQDLQHGCAVIADEQTGGLTRRGGSWVSRRGESLLMSVLLKDAGEAWAPVITLACGLAVARVLNALCGCGFGIKWPNDIVFGSKKVCGILCQSIIAKPQTVMVCGIGVNLTQDKLFFEESGLSHAASVKMLTGGAPSCEEMAVGILSEFEKIYDEYKERGANSFIDEYCGLCVTLGRPVRAVFDDGAVDGLASSIDPDGSLVIDTAGGRVKVNSGEVSVRGIMGYI